MNPPTSLGGVRRDVLFLAAIQGVAADLLLREHGPALSLLVWAALGVIGVAAIGYREHRELSRSTWLWLGVALACSALVAGRAAEPLLGLTIIAGAGSLAFAAWSSRGGRPFLSGITDHAAQLVAAVLATWVGLFHWLVPLRRPDGSGDLPPPVGGAPSLWPQWLRIGFGIAAAIPLLAVFGGLFAAADPVFQEGVRRILDLDFEWIAKHSVFGGVWAWIVAGYGHRLLVPAAQPAPPSYAPTPPPRAPTVEVFTALGLLALLFLAFVAIQVRYLFGDDTLVRTTAGLTYAEYARRGFFELLCVVALLLPVLLGADWLVARERDRRRFQVLAGCLLALLAMVMASAWKRLNLYTTAYGWTEARLYASAVLCWLALVTIAFVATVLPGHRARFAGLAVAAAYAVLLGLHALNPDAFIARRNLARETLERPLDQDSLQHLGADAAPVLLQGLTRLEPARRTALEQALVKRWARANPDWRAWNYGRWQARQAVAHLVSTPP